jgi:NhaP-type Na+/H+ or K+/H+ antiporter
MAELVLFILVLFIFSLVSRRIEGTVLTPPMLFVFGGMIVGPEVLGLSHGNFDSKQMLVLGEIALALLLFSDAVHVGSHLTGKAKSTLATRLLGIGMPVTIALGTALGALLLFRLTLLEAAIVATVLAPTDAALGHAVVSNKRVPERIRRALTVEAGLNDGLSVPFLTLFLVLVKAEHEVSPGLFFLKVAAEQIGLGALSGIAVGAVGGWLLRKAVKRQWVSGTYAGLAALALALMAYALADLVHGNGFIAAFVGGLATGWMSKEVGEHVSEFAEQEGQLFNFAVFYVFGLVALTVLRELTWEVVFYAVMSLTIIRMLPVAAALRRQGLSRNTVLFMGWFGPRGLASIVLGLIVVEHAPEVADRAVMAPILIVTVLLSVLAHGITAAPLSEAFARKVGFLPADSPERRGEQPVVNSP